MHMHIEVSELFVIIGTIGIGAQWLAWRLHLPAIFLLMLAGLIIGPALGLINPAEYFGEAFYTIIELFVALILFEGGLNLHWHELRGVAKGVLRLIVYAVPIAFIGGALAGYYIGGLFWPIALVFSAIIIVTGPTVIMPLLRHTNLQKRPATYLKWEGIINDPIGALLTVVVFNFLNTSDGINSYSPFLHMLSSLTVGTILGHFSSKVVAHLIIKGVIPEFLKPLVLLMSVFVVFILANLVSENAGLLATTLFGLFLGNTGIPDILSLRRFKESITLLLLSTLFVLLAASIQWHDLQALTWQHYLLLLVIIFILRPMTIFLATIGSEMNFREKLFVGWIAPRGIVAASVAAVLGHNMIEAGFAQANILMPLVFSLILMTVILHGFSIKFVAKTLDLAAKKRNGVLIVGANQWSVKFAKLLSELDIPVLLADSVWDRLRPARLDGIPVYFGEILSEDAEQNVDLSTLGIVFACTDNEAYNTLVSNHFIPEFGRGHVYQMPTGGSSEDQKQVQAALKGTMLYGKELSLPLLIKNSYFGWRFSKTKITESFDIENFRLATDKDAIAIATINTKDELRFITTENALDNIKSATIVTYSPPKTE